MLEQSVKNFTAPIYTRTTRCAETYATVADYCQTKLNDLVNDYRMTKNNQQLLREIRNDIDYYLRRYHEYCIQQRPGIHAHYFEIGVDEKFDFEHLIPAARIRDLFLSGIITCQQALNSPTVRLSRSKHQQLKDAGWASKTPDMWLPFKRYSLIFDARFQTYDGIDIDPDSWTLTHHYDYFKHLIG